MTANTTAAARTGRKKLAQGKERSDAALGHDSQNTSSPDGAKDLPNGWRVSASLQRASHLRQLILQKAFTGELA